MWWLRNDAGDMLMTLAAFTIELLLKYFKLDICTKGVQKVKEIIISGLKSVFKIKSQSLLSCCT